MTRTNLALLSTDEAAVKILEACDYSKRISREEAEAGTAFRAVRIIVDGVFDLFHIGKFI